MKLNPTNKYRPHSFSIQGGEIATTELAITEARELTPTLSEQIIGVHLSLRGKHDAHGRKLIAKCVEEYKATLTTVYAEGVAAERRRLRFVEAEYQSARERLDHLFTLESQGGLSPLELESLTKRCAAYEAETVDLSIAQVGKRARYDVLSRRLNEGPAGGKKKVPEDAVVAELEEIVRLLETQLNAVVKNVKSWKDEVRAEEVIRQEQLELARAKANLAARREVVARTHADNQLVKLRAELAVAITELAEVHAKSDVMRDMLREVKPRLAKARHQSVALQAEIAEAKEELKRMTRLRRTFALPLERAAKLRFENMGKVQVRHYDR